MNALTVGTLLVGTVLLAGSVASHTQSPNATPIDGTRAVVGRVFETGTGEPVPGALVTLTGFIGDGGRLTSPLQVGTDTYFTPSISRSVLTSPSGHFAFHGLAAGQYRIDAEAIGYEPPRYQHRVVEVSEEGAPATVQLRLWRFASISGRVIDERGEPVVGATVATLQRLSGGRSPAVERRAATEVTTDDRGVYRIGGLSPGSYLVGALSTTTTLPTRLGAELDASEANSRVGSPLWLALRDGGTTRVRSGEGLPVGDLIITRPSGPPLMLDPDGSVLTYPTTYYPATTNAITAEVVTLTSGEDRGGIDIPVAFSRTVRVSGTVTGPDGPVANQLVRLIPPHDTVVFTRDVLTAAEAVTSATGRFVLDGVTPGNYRLSTVRFPSSSADFDAPSEDWLWATQAVSVGERDIDGLVLSMAPGLRINGRVVFDGEAGSGLTADQLVGVVPIPLGASGASWNHARPDGTFTTSGIPPGRYRLEVQINCRTIGGCPTNWTWQSTLLNGTRLPYDVIELEDSAVDGLVITMTERPSGLSGSIVDASGQPDALADVIVFPADTTLWREEPFHRRVRRAHASSNAGFAFPDLAPGEYYAVAVEAPYPYEDPGALDRLVPGATKVALGESEQVRVRLETYRHGGENRDVLGASPESARRW